MQTRLIISAFLVLWALGFGVSAAPIVRAQSAQQFELPPAPIPRETPQVQGPVDIDGPVPVAPRAIETDTPAPSPTPSETFEPILSEPASDTEAEPSDRTPSSATVRQDAAPAPQAATDAESPALAPAPALAEPTTQPEIQPSQQAASPAEPETSTQDTQFWLWIACVAALLLAAAGTYLIRRSQSAKPAPTIEPPISQPEIDRPDEQPVTETTSAPTVAEPMSLQIEVISLSRSLMNATLTYRVTVLNRTSEAIADIALEADLTSAGQGRPMEQQVALPDSALPIRHQTPRMSAGQSARFEGQVQLPLNQAVAIRQGKAALLVPLLRLRLTANGIDPMVKTLVIGQAGTNVSPAGSARLQPFALDDGPRSWSPIAHRQLDALS